MRNVGENIFKENNCIFMELIDNKDGAVEVYTDVYNKDEKIKDILKKDLSSDRYLGCIIIDDEHNISKIKNARTEDKLQELLGNIDLFKIRLFEGSRGSVVSEIIDGKNRNFSDKLGELDKGKDFCEIIMDSRLNVRGRNFNEDNKQLWDKTLYKFKNECLRMGLDCCKITMSKDGIDESIGHMFNVKTFDEFKHMENKLIKSNGDIGFIERDVELKTWQNGSYDKYNVIERREELKNGNKKYETFQFYGEVNKDNARKFLTLYDIHKDELGVHKNKLVENIKESKEKVKSR